MGNEVLITNNHDIAGIYNRINRYIEEEIFASSSGVNEMDQFDQVRFASYLDSLDVYVNHVVAQPQGDYPKTHPREIALEKTPEIKVVENESINDIVRMLCIMRDELINSASSRNPSGLIIFDITRVKASILKLRMFLNDYIAKVTPLDMPESSPRALQAGAGRTGI